jgi:hypothetical protein
MYQPYPAGTQLPEVQRPSLPAQVPSTAYFKGIIGA